MPSSYALGEHFEKLMTELIAAGRYNSKSEILRDGLRVIEDREQQRKIKLERLRVLLKEAEDSGPDIPAEDVFAELAARYES